LVAVPVVVELLWLATYLPKRRRWRQTLAEVERKMGHKAHPVDDLDLVYMRHAFLLTGEGRAHVAKAEMAWSKRFLLYHLPAILAVHAAVGQVPNLLMGFKGRHAAAMVGTAAAYGAVCFLIARLLA
jgi:hypothetical protein